MRSDQDIPATPYLDASYDEYLDRLERIRNIERDLEAMNEEEERIFGKRLAFADALYEALSRLTPNS